MGSACGNDAKIRIGDTGTRIQFVFRDCSPDVYDPIVDCEPPILDISAAAKAEIGFSLPDESDVIFENMAPGSPGDVQFLTDGTDGIIEWTAPAGFFALGGRWERAARITLPSGVFSTGSICFEVGRTIFN